MVRRLPVVRVGEADLAPPSLTLLLTKQALSALYLSPQLPTKPHHALAMPALLYHPNGFSPSAVYKPRPLAARGL